MGAVLVEKAKDSKEDNACDNREVVLVDDLEEIEHEPKNGGTGELAGRRIERDAKECEECVEELIEESEQRNT